VPKSLQAFCYAGHPDLEATFHLPTTQRHILWPPGLERKIFDTYGTNPIRLVTELFRYLQCEGVLGKPLPSRHMENTLSLMCNQIKNEFDQIVDQYRREEYIREHG
jgi:hypothetical protein